MRLALLGLAALVLVGGETHAASVLINNGLAPPDPANVIDDAAYAADFVRVRNAGCDVFADAPCASPGAPTTVALVDGGVIGENFEPMDTSTILMSGGSIVGDINTFQSATVTITGGSVGQVLQAGDSSTVTLRGGTVGSTLTAAGSSTFVIAGSDFKLDGVSVALGDITAFAGVLTGTLESGDSLNNAFVRSSLATITLVPEPGAAPLLAGGLLLLGILFAPRH